MKQAQATGHLHIGLTRRSGQSVAVVKGTETEVVVVAGYYKTGMSAEEIMEALPHLSPAQVYDALSYYHDHQKDVDEEIQRASVESLIAAGTVAPGKNGRLLVKGERE